MPSQKSKYAFQFSMETLCEDVTEVFLWTFTWAKVLDISVAAKQWGRFLSDHNGFYAAFPYAFGLRVFEQHPGKWVLGQCLSHGLHVHAVIKERLPVDVVRSIWNRKAGGRIHVKSIPKEKAIYLAKYLAKKRIESLKGRRLWAPFGKWEASKVRDITVGSPWAENYRLLNAALAGFKKLRWDQRARIVTWFTAGQSVPDALARIGLKHA